MKKYLLFTFMLLLSITMLVAQAISEYTYSTVTNGSLENMSTGTTDLLPTGTYYYLVSSGIANIGFGFNFGPVYSLNSPPIPTGRCNWAERLLQVAQTQQPDYLYWHPLPME